MLLLKYNPYMCYLYARLAYNPFSVQIIANFSASWCGPCRQIAPLYVELSKKYPQLVFLTVDVDELTVSIFLQ